MVPNKEEPESDSELTEEDATQPEQPEEPAEPAVENAVAEEPAAEEALQHVVDAAELTKECVDRLVEENGAEKALAEVGKCRVVKLRNLALSLIHIFRKLQRRLEDALASINNQL